MTTYFAENVYEAVKLAEEFKQQGRHEWFRGQQLNWPLKSSFIRKNEDERKLALEKLRRFNGWVKRTPGLETIAVDEASIIAIAQHYALPTNFLDFTTEPLVAGYFASFEKPSNDPVFTYSSILCLNKQEYSLLWKDTPSKGVPIPQFIAIDVQNLWRLQAQYGTFVYYPYDGDVFEMAFPMDRILFPYTGLISGIELKDIYPQRKSHLEILLEQYFKNETLIEAQPLLEQLFDKPIKLPEWKGYEQSAFIGNKIPPKLDSWNEAALTKWYFPTTEQWHEVLSSTIWELQIDSTKELLVISQEVTIQVEQFIAGDSTSRNKLIQWSIKDHDGSNLGILKNDPYQDGDGLDFNRHLEILWDGVRILPYNDVDIAISIGNCIALLLHDFKNPENSLPASTVLFGDTAWVAFSAGEGSYSEAAVSSKKLWEAIRDDIEVYLKPLEKQRSLGNVYELLGAITLPDRVFEFDRLAKLFVQQFVPYQVYGTAQIYVEVGKEVIYFSPASLKTLGQR